MVKLLRIKREGGKNRYGKISENKEREGRNKRMVYMDDENGSRAKTNTTQKFTKDQEKDGIDIN